MDLLTMYGFFQCRLAPKIINNEKEIVCQALEVFQRQKNETFFSVQSAW